MSNFSNYQIIWSYSVYGNNHEMYFKPLLKVIPLANSIGATVVINTPRAYHAAVLNYFHAFINQIVVLVHDGAIAENYPKILRFLVPIHIYSKYYFFKDSDSLVETKELAIMEHWMKSENTTCMIIRDHPQHVTPILAGMFASTREHALIIATAAEKYFVVAPSKFNSYSYDQDWLMDQIYPVIKESAQVYTSYFFYTGERVFKINRSLPGCTHIGSQCLQSPPSSSRCRWCDSIYGNDLLRVPFVICFNRLFPRLIYGRVRPTLILAFIYSRFVRQSYYNQLSIP